MRILKDNLNLTSIGIILARMTGLSMQIYLNVSEVPYVKETQEIKEIIENPEAL